MDKWEVWVSTKKGSAVFSEHDTLTEAINVVKKERCKLWLRLPEFDIRAPDGHWYSCDEV